MKAMVYRLLFFLGALAMPVLLLVVITVLPQLFPNEAAFVTPVGRVAIVAVGAVAWLTAIWWLIKIPDPSRKRGAERYRGKSR